MKLYYSPGACSLSPHIALRESGLPFDLVRVSLSTKKTHAGEDFLAINPKGMVPTLMLDDGDVLTEGTAVVQYIADQAPTAKLAPPAGTIARYHLQEWLAYLSTEVHKTFSPLFRSTTPDEQRVALRDTLGTRFDWIVGRLGTNEYLTGKDFCVADGYLFTLLNWTRLTGIDLSRWPTLVAFQSRVAARPAVHAALVAEGLVKS